MIEDSKDLTPTPRPQAEQPRGDLVGTAREAGAVAQERLGELRDAARSTFEDARTAAADKADEAKGQAADEIARTAQGLETAAKEMEGSPVQQELLREAADGLKHIARAVQGKSIGTMVGDLSEFGRQNPVAYVGAAALAGFALARFARASAPVGPSGYLDRPGSSAASRDRDRGDEARPVSAGLAGGSENG